LRILFVCVTWSFHTARWVNQLKDSGWDVHLFPLDDTGVHRDLRGATVHDARHGRPPGAHETLRAVDDYFPFLKNGYPFARGSYLARRIEHRLFPEREDRARRLAHTIDRLQPDLIHSLSLVPSGDTVLQASKHLKRPRPPWLVTSWGSDICLFPRLVEYGDKIRDVLANCDYFNCDCERDIRTAKALGFKGETLPVFPGGGGFDLERIRALPAPAPPSERRTIFLKGQHNWVGRAQVGVRALELCADLLRDYKVRVFLADFDVKASVQLLAQNTGIDVEIASHSGIVERPYEEILSHFGSARASIGLSISDGLPLSVLEAMMMGSFPIQSNTSCADEWLKDGETALFVHPEDPEQIAAALRRALTDDALVDRAAEINRRLVAERLDRKLIQPQVVAMYERVAARRPQSSVNT
jgi:glycosyltransferase involved in cell wall biosynthesis